MTWDEYYSRFYDWAESTQVSRISSLENFGSSDEVCEIAQNLFNDTASNRLIRKAIRAGVRFTPAEVIDLIDYISPEMVDDLVQSNSQPYSVDDLDYLYGIATDETLRKVAKSSKVKYTVPGDSLTSSPTRTGGFWTVLAALLGGSHGGKHKHNGHCDGDCSNCPAHYGYRYGRWYYGHGHQHGCEFGGNGGATGRCYRD